MTNINQEIAEIVTKFKEMSPGYEDTKFYSYSGTDKEVLHGVLEFKRDDVYLKATFISGIICGSIQYCHDGYKLHNYIDQRTRTCISYQQKAEESAFCTVVHGVSQGINKEFVKDQAIRTCHVKDGLLDGICYKQFQNGKDALIQYYQYHAGHGPYLAFDTQAKLCYDACVFMDVMLSYTKPRLDWARKVTREGTIGNVSRRLDGVTVVT